MKTRTALIIDDDPDVTTYLGTLLEDHGWKVLTSNSPNDGIAMAKAEKPDVILLDVMMPERGGLSTLIALRKDKNLSSVKIVLVTGIQETLKGANFESFLDRFKHYPPSAYLEKPIDADALLAKLDELTGGA